jgi:hypothetical protein
MYEEGEAHIAKRGDGLLVAVAAKPSLQVLFDNAVEHLHMGDLQRSWRVPEQ